MTSPTDAFAADGMISEHRLQLDLLSALKKVVKEDTALSDVDALIERLAEYTEVHFASEQLLMRLYAYPGYQAHLDEHDRTLTWLNTLRVAWRGHDAALTRETADELAQWIEGHIRRSDAAFEHYLDSLRPPAP